MLSLGLESRGNRPPLTARKPQAQSSMLHVHAPKAEGGDVMHEGQPKEKVLAKP
jgi:hypothetical protein